MKVKAKDRIQLGSGEVCTLDEAISSGKVFLKEVDHQTRAERFKGVTSKRYIAREADGDLYWEIGQTLYESRMGKTISAKR